MAYQNRITHPLSRRTFLRLSSLLAVGSTLVPFASLGRELKLKEIKRAAFTMGSIVTITAYCKDEQHCNRALDEVFKEMKTIDKLMSVFDARSQLSLVNRHSYEREIQVDARIIDVLLQAKHFYDLTSGAFDVTIEPLMELYGFRDDTSLHHFPSDKEIADVLDAVGMKNITFNCKQETVNLLHPRTRLDFGGIAVGYAIDRAVNILKSYGIESALINHSGDIFALGSPPEEDSWEVVIVDPLHPEEIITTVRIKNQALSTSGNYENFVDLDGHRIGHLLNPASGKTASSILSGTTIAPTAIEADALSTGLFVLGIEQSKAIVQRSKNVKLIAISTDGKGETIMTL
jgi:thiamine biosynthesis lipoprotein